MLRHIVHLRGVDNVTASCPPNRMDGESTVEMIGEKKKTTRFQGLKEAQEVAAGSGE